MGTQRAIWRHECRQADMMAERLLSSNRPRLGWRAFLLFPLLFVFIIYRRQFYLTRKNLLFTKRLAFDAAKGVFRGENPASEMRLIEVETKKVLDRDKKGYYSEKVRRKQLNEVKLLMDHYLSLFNTGGKKYEEMVRRAYSSSDRYRSFMSKLDGAEQEVIQASVSSVRRGSRKERQEWFRRVSELSMECRSKEIENIFNEK